MSALTPGWKFISIGFEGAPVSVQGVDPWRHEGKWVSRDEAIVVSHPSYPSERHRMFVYTLDIGNKEVTFAAGEYSNGAWGFYEPI